MKAGSYPALAKFFAAGSALVLMLMSAGSAMADENTSGEANLKLPDLSQVKFLWGIDGHKLLVWGILFCVFGLAFGMTIYIRLKNLPVHRSMREISELIYETCKTYLDHAGQVPAAAVGLHRGRSSCCTSACCVQYEPIAVVIILAVQRRGNLRKLWRGVVRHSREHVCELADGVCGPARQTLSDLSDSAARGHEHRHDADQR